MVGLRGLYILDEDAFDLIYGPQERAEIAQQVRFVAPLQTRDSIARRMELLKDVEVIFSGWGMPRVDKPFLDAAPNLKAIFYAAGATGYFMTEHVFARGIVVTSASIANAQPVAEYTLAAIIFSLKHGWSLTRRTRATQTFPDRNGAPGCYQSSVGLVSLGDTGRAVARLLRQTDLSVFAYDPYVSPADAESMGVKLISLRELFATCDVVSLHTPVLAETMGMITGAHIASMKQGATLINTARGEIIREHEMIGVLTRRPDLEAVLDVTSTEPPPAGSPFYDLPNITLTPHIAGSVGNECHRMGRMIVDELARYLAGQPLKGLITQDSSRHSTHCPVEVTVHARPAPAKPLLKL
jgi:phosphoglycerate dehydrogenase-like enzyme